MTKTMDYNGHYLVYKEYDPCNGCAKPIDCEMCDEEMGCKGCFFKDEPGCPNCGAGIWVEASNGNNS